MATPASFVPASELLASEAASASVLPRGCTFTETDWRALAPFWYPVAFTHEVTDKPYAVRLLDERVVVYRLSDGGLAAARDICFHRGVPLVFAEDIAIVEQQWPEDLPLDLHAEAHFPADRSSITYRKGLAGLGLGRSYTA